MNLTALHRLAVIRRSNDLLGLRLLERVGVTLINIDGYEASVRLKSMARQSSNSDSEISNN